MRLCGFDIGLDKPFFVIAGPCSLETEELAIEIAQEMKSICSDLGIHYIFKASYDKANRTSGLSYRGPGIQRGLEILAKVRETVGVPVITDVHTAEDVPLVAKYVDVLQTPAFLCRQTDFIRACAQSGRPVNIKKGQFMAPGDMLNVMRKARDAARQMNLPEDNFLCCERGASFGYGNLVSDMRSLVIMRQTGHPVVYDATHSVQLPGGNGTTSGGAREFVPALARAAVAVGISGIFMETHPNPDEAKSDGPNLVPLHHMRELLRSLVEIDRVVKAQVFLENKIME